MVKFYLFLFCFLGAFASVMAQSLPFGPTRLRPFAASQPVPSSPESYIQPREFEAQPTRLEIYGGSPGNWILAAVASIRYTPAGRFDSVSTSLYTTQTGITPYATKYEYNALGWITCKKFFSNGTLSDSMRVTYTTAGSDNKITQISIYDRYGTNINRLVYNAAGKPDSLNTILISGGPASKYREKFTYDSLGAWIGVRYQYERGPNTGAWIDLENYTNLRHSMGVTEFKPEWIVAPYYDQNDEIHPPYIGGEGTGIIRDSLPYSTYVRFSGSDTGGILFNRVEVRLNGIWRNHAEDTYRYDQHGNITEDMHNRYYLSGQLANQGGSRYTYTYDSQGRLTELIQNDRNNNNYQRKVYSQFAPVSTRKILQQYVQTWPNPAGNSVQLAGIPAGTEYAIQTMHGVTLLSGRLPLDFQIDLTALAPGLYLVQAGSATARVVKK